LDLAATFKGIVKEAQARLIELGEIETHEPETHEPEIHEQETHEQEVHTVDERGYLIL
jgi:chromosome condensin MukBEF MukE localization factor